MKPWPLVLVISGWSSASLWSGEAVAAPGFNPLLDRALAELGDVGRFILVAVVFAIALIIGSLIRRRLGGDEVLADDQHAAGKLLLRALCLPLRLLLGTGLITLTVLLLLPAHFATGVWLAQVLLSLVLAIFIYNLVGIVEFFLQRRLGHVDTPFTIMLLPVLGKILRILVLIIAGLQIYQCFTGQPLTSILAGLGIGGLAFALAAQDLLKNIFGFVIIALDRPFAIGEHIVYDKYEGTVQEVSLRSTTLRLLDHNIVTIPNARLTDAVIQNNHRRQSIKRQFNLVLPPDTSIEKIETALALIRDILKNHEGQPAEAPPQAAFSDFVPEGFQLQVVYWYEPPVPVKFQKFSEQVNLEIMRRFSAAGLSCKGR